MYGPRVSVIICTHNPRAHYLHRVLAALKRQTVPFDEWELLLIDNASRDQLTDEYDIGWHPNGRHIRENELGLSPARLRAVMESTADLIVFVDDDNVLREDYLEHACRIASEFPQLGTWGGQCLPEFETEPAPELTPYLGGLALRTTERDSWTNMPGGWNDAYPFGAGLCVRRAVANEFHRRTKTCPLRQSLERRGQSLMSGQDYDISLTACDMGLGCGVFKNLVLTHIMPAARLSSSYLLRLAHAHAFSNAVLFTARGRPPRDPLATRLRWYYRKAALLRHSRPERDFRWAQMVGVHEGLRYCQKIGTSAEAAASPAEPSFDRVISDSPTKLKLQVFPDPVGRPIPASIVTRSATPNRDSFAAV
jgi:glycosyltransferase involved in cell wall biosynthesis